MRGSEHDEIQRSSLEARERAVRMVLQRADEHRTFVIDVYARRIVGWRTPSALWSDLALDALSKRLAIGWLASRVS